ncbi:MAG: DUF4339 domain-containing protein [Pirellulales bacterium]|nr:DUF4339 domain-containing protein [Pirellulales bacterium]
MGSRWFCRVLGEELGPLEFGDLRRMVRSGTLREDDRVRRETAREWTRADSVIGLFREEDVGEEAKEIEEPAPSAEMVSRKKETRSAVGRRRWVAALRLSRQEAAIVVGGVAAVVVLNVLPWLLSLRESRRFPRPELDRARGVSQEVLATVVGPPPKEPSVRGLQERQPQPVPGLERLLGITSLSLAGDLKTIVFSAPSGPGGYGLFVARRKEVSEPFDWPVLIESCSSPYRQDTPALSSDGLMLVFVRYEPDTCLYSCHRSSDWIEFGTPTALAVPGLKAGRHRVAQPQFVDNEHLVFAVSDSATGQSSYRVAKRSAFGFEPPEGFSAWGMAPQARLSGGGLRAYSGGAQGLSLAVRGGGDQQFLQGRCILAADVTGPITAPVWVAAKEDVVFYCSPERGRPPNAPARMWMVRLL